MPPRAVNAVKTATYWAIGRKEPLSSELTLLCKRKRLNLPPRIPNHATWKLPIVDLTRV